LSCRDAGATAVLGRRRRRARGSPCYRVRAEIGADSDDGRTEGWVGSELRGEQRLGWRAQRKDGAQI
jgi:hypothetical protein